MALSIRKKEGIKVRQPLTKIIIPVRSKNEMNEIDNARGQILSEINVKNIEYLDNANSLLIKELKPNFKTLGPRFGSKLNKIVAEINQLDPEKFDDSEGVEIIVDNNKLILSKNDIEVNYKDIEGLSVASGGGQTIALDLNLNNDLINEGIAREIVNRIQNIRKSKGLEVTDKIDINIKSSTTLENAINSNLDYVKGETLAIKLYFSENLDEGEIIEFDNITTTITIKKV